MSSGKENDLRQRKAPDAAPSGDKVGQVKAAMSAKKIAMVEEEVKARKTVMALSEKAPAWATQYVQKAAPVFSWMLVIITTILPYLIEGCQAACTLYKKMHPNLLSGILGFITCFFGGFYPTLIATYEALKETGGEQTVQAVQEIAEEVNKFLLENEKDDRKDDDKEHAHEVLLRKSALALRVVNANKVSDAMSGLYTSVIGVAAVLKVRFARTLSLGVSIGENIKPVASKVLEPMLVSIIPTEYHQWIPVIINYFCKSIAMSIAWYIQMVLSAFHSAIRGGLMCTRGLMRYAHNQGWDAKAREMGIELDPDKTMLDEYAGWGLAALGFLFQMSFNFNLPFPFNVVLFPLTVTESIIRWKISDF